jgi:serine/threonine protein kinase/WD40 repeat protein
MSEADPAKPESSTVDHVPTDAPGARIGPYKLLQQIGEGGMGVVFMAEQEQPVRRRVALKIIKPGMDSVLVINRFRAEQQALALMDHQHIAKVHDAGTTAAGRPYFVMELVHGVPITKYCDDNKLTPRERLQLFLPVCRAVQHAHQKGIIHRDLKPSNVLVCLYDGKPVAKVIDFGVAKAMEQPLTDGTMFTQFGQVIGTLEYMSPEQAEMSQLGIDTRSDIYSLGVMLYELLTGSTPLQRARIKKAAFDEVLKLIREEDPPPPSSRLSSSTETLPAISVQRRMDPAQLAKALRGELDWIVMKSLEKDRTRRYETADGLAKDIERHLADEPVEAGPPSATYRLKKYARKHRTLLTVLSAFSLVLVAGTTISLWLAYRAKEAEHAAVKAGDDAKEDRNAAVKAREDLEVASEKLVRALYVADMNLVKAACDSGQLSRASELLERHRPKAGQPDLRGFEWFYWKRLLQSERDTVPLEGFGAHGTLQSGIAARDGAIAFSKSGRLCAAVQGVDQPVLNVTVWDSSTGKRQNTIPWRDALKENEKLSIAKLSFSDDESLLLLESSFQQEGANPGRPLFGPRELAVFSLRAGKRLYEMKGDQARFHSDSKRLLSLRTEPPMSDIGFAPDKEKAVKRKRFAIWTEATTGKELTRFELRSLWPNAVSDDCGRIAFEGPVGEAKERKRAIFVYDAAAGKLIREVPLAKGISPFPQMAFSADGRKFAFGSAQPSGILGGGTIDPVRCIDIETGVTEWTYSPPDTSGPLQQLNYLFDPRGDRFLLWRARISDRTESSVSYLLDARSGKLVRTIEYPPGPLTGSSFHGFSPVAFSRDGSLLIDDRDGRCTIYSARTGLVVARPKISSDNAISPILDVQDRMLIRCTRRGEIRRIDLRDAKKAAAASDGFERLAGSTVDQAFLHFDEGRFLAMQFARKVEGDTEIRIYDGASGRKLRTLRGTHLANPCFDTFTDTIAIVDDKIRILGSEEASDRILVPEKSQNTDQRLRQIPTLCFLPNERGVLLRDVRQASSDVDPNVYWVEKSAYLVDIKTCRRVPSWWDKVDKVEHLVPSPDQKSVLIARIGRSTNHGANHLRLADIETGRTLWEAADLGYAAVYSVFSSNGKKLLTFGLGRSGSVMELREMPSGKMVLRMDDAAAAYPMTSAFFSPDDRRILMIEGSPDEAAQVRIFDLGGNELAVIPMPLAVTASIHLSKDGTQLRALRPNWESLPRELWLETIDATPLRGDEPRAHVK